MKLSRTMTEFRYVLKREQDDDSPTRWIFRKLTSAEHAAFLDSYIGDSGKEGTLAYRLLRSTLVRVENLQDELGNPFEPATESYAGGFGVTVQTVGEDFLDLLDASDRNELASAAANFHTTTEDDAKN